MPLPAHESATEGDWTPVSAKHPCSICGGHDGCRRGFGDAFACCVRTASDWPLTTGGWVHRLELARAEMRASASSVYATTPASGHVSTANGAWDEASADVVSVAS